MLGSGRGLIKRLFWHLLARSAESHKRSREVYLLARHIVYSGKKEKNKRSFNGLERTELLRETTQKFSQHSMGSIQIRSENLPNTSVECYH